MPLGLKLITPPATSLFTAAEARERARLASALGDAAIDDLVAEAARFIGTELSRQLLAATWRQTQDGFDDADGLLRLWRNPVLEIETIEYLDEDGEWCEVDDWELDSDSEPALVYPAVGAEWPAVYDRASNVMITFNAGFGETVADVPEDLRRAAIMLVSHFHEHPEAVGLGADARTFEVPLGVADILDHYRYGRRF